MKFSTRQQNSLVLLSLTAASGSHAFTAPSQTQLQRHITTTTTTSGDFQWGPSLRRQGARVRVLKAASSDARSEVEALRAAAAKARAEADRLAEVRSSYCYSWYGMCLCGSNSLA